MIKINKIKTSKEEILKTSCKLIKKQKDCSINIRDVAKECNISIGSIYHYFDSKDDLVIATIEEIWSEIFNFKDFNSKNILDCIDYLFQRLSYADKKYPNFLNFHSLSLMKNKKMKGKVAMEKNWKHIIESLNEIIKNDKDVKNNFLDKITFQNISETIFSLMLSALIKKDYDCFVLKEIVKKILYQ